MVCCWPYVPARNGSIHFLVCCFEHHPCCCARKFAKVNLRSRTIKEATSYFVKFGRARRSIPSRFVALLMPNTVGCGAKCVWYIHAHVGLEDSVKYDKLWTQLFLSCLAHAMSTSCWSTVPQQSWPYVLAGRSVLHRITLEL